MPACRHTGYHTPSRTFRFAPQHARRVCRTLLSMSSKIRASKKTSGSAEAMLAPVSMRERARGETLQAREHAAWLLKCGRRSKTTTWPMICSTDRYCVVMGIHTARGTTTRCDCRRHLRFVLCEVETALRVDAVSEEARQRPARPKLSRNITSARRLPYATWAPPTRRSAK